MTSILFLNIPLWVWCAFLVIGATAGLLAGIFGVGGGLFLVPILVSLFFRLNLPHSVVVHLALGTAMATILFTSFSSMRAHNARGAVLWPVVKAMALGVFLGTFITSQIAARVPTLPLSIIFVIITLAAALQMLSSYQVAPHRNMPRAWHQFLFGGIIGIISSLVSAGGGFLTVPYLLYHNQDIHKAVGTSAALGFRIAMAGTAGYIIAGWGKTDLPPHALGYVFLPALAAVVVMSMLFAPVGAHLSHKLPVHQLKRAFGVLLIILALNMVRRILVA